MDYEHLTAPCGLPCFACSLFLANDNRDIRKQVMKELGVPEEKASCRGCRNENGACPHLPVTCHVYPCAQGKGIHNCSQCPDFPCDLLHPYEDMAKLWHNTKVFHLCLIRKMGIEEWARNKAEQVLSTYSHEKWRL